MKIKSFGCSFIFGSDLADDGYETQSYTPSKLTWPALIAEQLSLDYECYAMPASGNLQILENVLGQIPSSNSDDLFVIGWTWVDRFDFTDLTDSWRTLLPVDREKEAKFYYKHLHSQYRDKLTSCIHIRTAIDALTHAKIPFLMTYMDELIFERAYHTTSALEATQKYIEPWLTNFNGKTFLDWARDNQYPISQNWHPLEAAHSAGAMLMLENIANTMATNLQYRHQNS